MNELTKVLSVKEQAQEQLLVVMQALGIGKIVRNLKFEIVRLQGRLRFHVRRNRRNGTTAEKCVFTQKSSVKAMIIERNNYLNQLLDYRN